MVSPRPGVSRPQAVRSRDGWSGGFGWWAFRRLDHAGSGRHAVRFEMASAFGTMQGARAGGSLLGRLGLLYPS